MSDLPSGAVTFLFTDIEGSTRLVRRLRGRYADVLVEHQRLLRQAFEAQGGHEIDTQGDAFFYAFASAHEAVLAAIAGQRALLGYPWPDDTPVKVRMGLHTGQSTPVNGRYTGLAVHRAARICAAGHGGQVVVSQATQSLLEDEEEDLAVRLQDLGEQRLKDIERPVRLYQVAAAGLPAEFPPLRQDAEADVPVGTRRHWTRRSRLLLALGAGVLLAAIAASVVLPRGGEDPVVIRSNSLVAIDAASNEPVANVPLRPGAGAVAVGEGAVWVGNARERTLSRVDPARNEVTSEIGLALGPEAIAVGEEGVSAAEADRSKPELSYATLTRVDPRANEERLTVRITPPNPLGAGEEPVLAAGEGALWVGNRDFARMYRLNPQSLDIVALVEGVNPFALVVGAGAVWAAEQDDQTVTRIELATNAVRLSIPYGVRQPGSAAFGAGAVWVTDTAEDRVWKIDATKNSVAGTIVVGDGPEFIAATPQAVWVANRFGKSISRIDPRTDTVVATIELGREPRGLATAGDSIWVTVS